MKNKKYETLDEYLDDLDKIKEKLAEEIRGMSLKEVSDYFTAASKRIKKKLGNKLRTRKPSLKKTTRR